MAIRGTLKNHSNPLWNLQGHVKAIDEIFDRFLAALVVEAADTTDMPIMPEPYSQSGEEMF